MKKLAIPALVLLLIVAGGLGWWLMRGEGETVASEDGDEGRARPKVVRNIVVPQVKRTAASGQVTDASTGEGLAGSVVQLVALDGREDEDDEGMEPLVADNEGRWSVDEVSSGRYRVIATAAGYLPGSLAEASLLADEPNVGLDIALSLGGNRVFGTISDVTGGAIEGAVVRVRPVTGVFGMRGADRFTTLSGEGGSYAIHMPDGRVRVEVWHPEYAKAGRVVTVAGKDRKVDFALTPMGVVEGVVLTEEGGEPVGNAKVFYALERDASLPGGASRAMSQSLGVTQSAADGTFRVSGVPAGTLALTAVAEGWASDEASRVTLALAERRTGVEVLVQTAYTIRGRVVSAGDGSRGVPGADVAVMSGNQSSGGAETDDTGAFELHGVQPGTRRLVAFAAGYVPTLNAATVTVDDDVDDVIIELEPGLVIRGRVEPPQVAEVSLRFEPSGFSMGAGLTMATAGSTTSAEDGTFEIRPVEPGDWTVEARSQDGSGGEAEVTVTEAGTPEVVIQLGERARVSGTVTDAIGNPVEGAVVQIGRSQSSSRTVTVMVNGAMMGATSAPTDEDGGFVAAGLAGGRYDVNVVGPLGDTLAWGDGSSDSLTLELGDGERRDGYDLSVEALDGVITGVVREADGGPLADVWVRAISNPEEPEEDEADEDEPSGMRMAFVVMDDSSGGGSNIGGSNGESRPVLTDADGRFRIDRLRNTEYSVIAEGTGSRSRTQKDGVRPGADIVIELQPTGGIVATVRFEGRSVSGGAAALSGPVSRSKTFDGDQVEIDGLEPGRYKLSVTSETGGSSVTVTVPPGENVDVDVDIEKWVRVSGRVVDGSGEPVVGARIILGDAPAEGSKGGLSIQDDGSGDQLLSGEDGRFETTAGGGRRMLVVLGADMPLPLAVKPFVVAGEDVDLGDVEAESSGFSFQLGGE